MGYSFVFLGLMIIAIAIFHVGDQISSAIRGGKEEDKEDG